MCGQVRNQNLRLKENLFMKSLLKKSLCLVIFALLIPTSSAKAQLCPMIPEKAKFELDYLRKYYDLEININRQQLINFAALWGETIESAMYLKLYKVPLHRVVVILYDKLAILEKISPCLEEADKKDADTFVQNFHYYINVIVNSNEYLEEKEMMVQQKQQAVHNNIFVTVLMLSLYHHIDITNLSQGISNLKREHPYLIDLLWACGFGFAAGVATVVITRATDATIDWIHNIVAKKNAEQAFVVAMLKAEEAAE